MQNGRFGPLIGVIQLKRDKTKFQIYSAMNLEVLTCHEVALEIIQRQEGWCEYDPNALLKAIVDSMQFAIQNLMLLDIDPKDIKGVGITNYGESCVLWDRTTGQVLHNAICTKDTRTIETAARLLKRARYKGEHIKEICGQVVSHSTSAVQLTWICENNERARLEVLKGTCCFGTLDSWIIWNLTGVHVTDVTNASRTMLYNLRKRTWDSQLCEFFKINPEILPKKILSCCEVFGFIHDGGLLQGVPIAGCISERPAQLIGQMCLKREQMAIAFNDDSNMIVNTGQEIICSSHGLNSTVAFQLGPEEPIFYALEGSVSNSGSSISWLSKVLNFSPTSTSNNQVSASNHNSHSESVYFSISPQPTICTTPPDLIMSDTIPNNLDFKAGVRDIASGTTRPNSNVMFVPAQTDPTPKHSFQQAGMLFGFSQETSAIDILQSAMEGVCFNMRYLLETQQKDCSTWKRIKTVLIGGDLIEANPSLSQMVADICEIETIECPQISSASSLGAMLAVGLTMKLFTLEHIRNNVLPHSELYHGIDRSNQMHLKYKQWLAFNEVMAKLKANEDVEQPKDRLQSVQRSIPGTVFLTTAFVLLLVADNLKKL